MQSQRPMLPPLNFTDTRGNSFSQSKQVDSSNESSRSRQSSRKRPSLQPQIRPSPRTARPVLTPREGESIPSCRRHLNDLSVIPRDYFVVETNDIVVPDKYPPHHYHSTLTAQGKWETVVFPALTPYKRQQVLYLWQTLDKMRATMPSLDEPKDWTMCQERENDEESSVRAERKRLIIEYTQQETHLYSLCFHELARQIKCICKEQSDLLHEIHERYDAAVARLLDQVKLRDQENEHHHHQVRQLATQYNCALEENKWLMDKVQLLDRQVREEEEIKCSEVSDESDAWEREKEEKEWKRQRKEATISFPSRKETTNELHLAATRVQVAYRAYQTRKQQSGISRLWQEKERAAVEIQRSYRGFRSRRDVLHRRAIRQVIKRRHKEKTAVKLLQAKVRTYLCNQRRVSTNSVVSATVSTTLNPTEETLVSFLTEKADEKAIPNASLYNEDTATSNRRQALLQMLTTLRELALTITTFVQRDGDCVMWEEKANTLKSKDSLSPEAPDVEAEDVALCQQTLQQAEGLVDSLYVMLRTFLQKKSDPDNIELPSHEQSEEQNSNVAESTNALDNLIFKDETQRLATPEATPFNSLDDNFQDISDEEEEEVEKDVEFRVNESIWSSATTYPEHTKETNARLARALSSHDQRKRLVALKQYISDIYDTIVGKLKDLPPSRLDEILAKYCHLTLSFTEWRQQRTQLPCCPARPTEHVTFNIHQLTRDHFRCRLGLPQLVEAALSTLYESINEFAPFDADVQRFQDFLSNERSHDELLFCCLCRYLCAYCLKSDESPAGTASSSYHRQPLFHPVTMREVLDIPHARELATLLFRVENEKLLINSDLPFTEVENLVYRQYLPTNGYHQFDALLSSSFIDLDRPAAADLPARPSGPSESLFLQPSRRPDGASSSSSRCASTLLRPTNYNQFHAKHYNVQAPKSPLVRHQASLSTTAPLKWVHFEHVVALLFQFRRDMHTFHCFIYWIQELFHLVAHARRQEEKGHVNLLEVAGFIEILLPLSCGLTDRDLKSIFHHSIHQRELQLFMPLRVFTSVVLLLLRNGLLHVSMHAFWPKLQRWKKKKGFKAAEDNQEKEWSALGLKWKAQEPLFEAAIKASFHHISPSLNQMHDVWNETSRTAQTLHLFQLHQQLYDLCASRANRGRDFIQACAIYDFLVNDRLERVGGDTRNLDAQLGPMVSFETTPWSSN